MYHFCYATKKEVSQFKKEVICLINKVQNELRDQFTFQFEFIGSVKLNLVTYDPRQNIGFDLDCNLKPNDPNEEYSPDEIRDIFMKAFDKLSKSFGFSYSQDSTRVFTIKIKDRDNSKIVNSVDFAIVFDCGNGQQQYIRFNKQTDRCIWEYQPKGYYQLQKNIEQIKNNGLWDEFKDYYLEKKNKNNDPNKKSRSLRAEAVKEICEKYCLD